MKLSKSAKVWVVILGLALLSWVMSIVEDGWDRKDLIGLGIWALLALCVFLFIRHKDRAVH